MDATFIITKDLPNVSCVPGFGETDQTHFMMCLPLTAPIKFPSNVRKSYLKHMDGSRWVGYKRH